MNIMNQFTRQLYPTLQQLSKQQIFPVHQSQKLQQIQKNTYQFSKAHFLSQIENLRKTDKRVPEQAEMKHYINSYGMNIFILRVYKTMGISSIAMLATVQLAISSGITAASPFLCSGIGLGLLVGGFGMASKLGPSYFHIDTIDEKKVLSTSNSPARHSVYGLGVFGLGLFIAPIFASLFAAHPAIGTTGILMTSGVVLLASVISYYRSQGTVRDFGKNLLISISSIIALNVFGIISQTYFGANIYSWLVSRFETPHGIFGFASIIAFNTHMAMQAYEVGDADHLQVSMEFFYNIYYLLKRFITVLKAMRKQQ